MAKSNHLSENEPERQKREQDMDKTLADSFPSSDPPSTITDPMTDEPAKQAANERAESPEEPAQGMAGKADRAFRTTAQSYLDRAGLKLDLRQVESTIREKPMQAAALAAAAGFLFGGGMGTLWGAAMLAFAAAKPRAIPGQPAPSREAVEQARSGFLRKWKLRCKAVSLSFEEAGDELFTFTAFPSSQWKALRTTNALERINEGVRRRTKTQASLPNEEAVLFLLFGLLRSGQVKLHRLIGWQALIRPQMEAA